MSGINIELIFFVALWLPIMGTVQLFTTYKRNKYRKHPKYREYKWGAINCIVSVVLYSYLISQAGEAMVVIGGASLVILIFILLFS